MTKKSALYTKSGDKGETSLVCGTRISKDEEQLYLYGEVDELNSWIGFLIAKLKRDDEVALLTSIQHQLFNLGSQLACSEENREKFKLPVLSEEVLKELEQGIDRLDALVPKLTNFILPGGHKASAMAHICRTVTRRVERGVVHWAKEGNAIPSFSVELLNRLSDYFFVLARVLNQDKGVEDVVWSSN